MQYLFEVGEERVGVGAFPPLDGEVKGAGGGFKVKETDGEEESQEEEEAESTATDEGRVQEEGDKGRKESGVRDKDAGCPGDAMQRGGAELGQGEVERLVDEGARLGMVKLHVPGQVRGVEEKATLLEIEPC